jgi:hypothetical protein
VGLLVQTNLGGKGGKASPNCDLKQEVFFFLQCWA